MSSTPIASERRLHPRYRIKKPVTLLLKSDNGEDSGVVSGTLNDISAGGAAVTVRGSIATGDSITLDMGDFGMLEAEVLRAVENRPIACRFALSEEQANHLSEKLTQVFHGISKEDSENDLPPEDTRHKLVP